MRKYLLGLLFCIFVVSMTDAQSVKYSTSSSGWSDDQAALEINTYPNPAVNDLTIQIKNGGGQDYQFIIYNILGREIRKFTIDSEANAETKMNISFLKKGVYLYRVINNRGKTILTRRLMVVRP